MKKVTSISIAIALASTISLPAILYAQAPVVPAGQATVVDQCQKVTEKVDLKISNYSEAHSNFDTKFGSLIQKLKTVAEKLSARGMDTATLTTSITALETKRAKLSADKQALVSKLQESKQFTCGASQGQFKTKITEAKALQKTVVADSKDMQASAKTIRDAVKALRATVASSTPTL
jgi:septal ring factor EnvC (AmiA/AmiB activator)